MKKNLILIGFKGVGKTFIGKKVATHFDMGFIDTDHLIEGYFNFRLSIAEIYSNYGEKKFREFEKEVIKNIKHKQNYVIATGGGVVEIEGVEKYLRNLGAIVYLYNSLDILISRWGAKPRVIGNSPVENLYNRRTNLYENICDRKVKGQWDQILLENIFR